MTEVGSAPRATAIGQRPVRVAEPLLAHLRSAFDDDSLVYSAPPRPLGSLWHYTVEGLPNHVPAHQVVRVAAGRTAIAIEAALQGAAHAGGFPVPEIVVAGHDVLAMEYVEGQPLASSRSSLPLPLRLGDRRRARSDLHGASVLGALLADLHRLDPTAAVAALGEDDSAEALGLDRPLRLLEDDLGVLGEPTLLTAYERLLASRPVGDGRLAICHGRLGPETVRLIDGRVSAITGWDRAVIADPAYDVGATLTELRVWSATSGRRTDLAAAFLRVYDDLIAIDRDAFAWFEALHCLCFVVRHQHQLASSADTGRSGHPASVRSTSEVVTALTGVDLHLAG